jgi:hypothetical protein
MKKLKLILLRGTFYVLSLQMLNVSIDVDYIFHQSSSSIRTDIDDLDSYTELLSEQIAGDENYTSEQDDDAGDSQDQHLLKFNIELLFFSSNVNTCFHIIKLAGSTSLHCFGRNKKICEGYFLLIAPPPKYLFC